VFSGHCGGDGCFGAGGTDACFNDCCPPRAPFWAYGEYLLWYAREQNVPPLVTASPAGTPIAAAGVLGNSAILYDRIDNNPRSGGRFGLGFWFPNHDCWGMDANFFALGNRSGSFTASGTGLPGSAFIARPIFNPLVPGEEALIVAGNGVPVGVGAVANIAGSITINDYSKIWGMDANLRRKLHCGPNGWIDGLVGYRYFSLSEGIDIIDNENFFDPATGAGITNIRVNDSFHTRNTFNGPQLGLTGERRIGQRWFLAGSAKVALGAMRETVDTQGFTTFSPTGLGTTVQPGGILALPTNSGHFSQTRFAVIPEVGMNLGLDVTDHLRLYAGYNFMFVSSVVRPGEQIDRVVNRTQIPTALGPSPLVGTPRPAVLFQTNEFWLQGVNFGLQYHY
jgi:hypothetical protein